MVTVTKQDSLGACLQFIKLVTDGVALSMEGLALSMDGVATDGQDRAIGWTGRAID